jgi:3-oxoacyl-[acyl-carrier protein] reductase
MNFENKTVLVTGASRGIGRACAVSFAKARAKAVVVSYAGNDAAAKETCALIESAGSHAHALKFDVSRGDECAKAVEQIAKDHGTLDVLVNNAGISIDGLIMRYKEDDWERTLGVNLKSVFYLCKAASRPMMRQKSGAIVNLTSVVGEMGNAGQTAYSASKAGIIGFTKSLARELSSRNIRVNCVSPGFVETDMTAAISVEARKAMLDSVPLARAAATQDVANAVLFLASDLAGYITGEVLRVNGGMYM